jgi:hypothetical protein
MTAHTEALPLRSRIISSAMLLPMCATLLALWQIGVYVDVWYHLHYGFEIETFFTLPHALMYAGWALSGLVPAIYLGESIGQRRPRHEWLPAGFPLVLIGSAIFGVGGAFDFIWHSLVGFEARHEAVLAPSHLWLAIGYSLSAFGLLEAAVRQRAAAGIGPRLRAIDLPVIVALAILLRMALWYATYGVPLGIDFASGGVIGSGASGYAGLAWTNEAAQIAGTLGILLNSLLLALFLTVALRWLRLPAGAIAIIMLYDALLITLATDMGRYLPAVVGAALIGEALWAWVRSGGLGGPEGEAGYWTIGAVVPAVQFALYFVVMAVAGGGIIWTPHLWAGVPVAAAIVGLTATMLAVPPRFLRATS